MITIDIQPISREIKQINNQYKTLWIVERVEGDDYLLTTVEMVHNNSQYPYSCWAKLGRDFNFLKENK